MILSSTKRDKLFEIDARWPVKITFRVILNMICILSIICAMFTLTHNSNFNPKPFTQARTVLVYIPCDGITIAWNIINIVYLLGRNKAFSNVTNVMVHFFLGTGFAIVGIYVTVTAWNAKIQLVTDPYGIGDGKDHHMTSITAQNITVNSNDVSSCPAFPDCAAQSEWEHYAGIRALISVIGCVLFDIAFCLHVVFFLWCCNDTVFGLRGRSQRKHEKEERERRKLEEKGRPSPVTSATNNSFDIEALPARPLQKSHSASSLRSSKSSRPLQKSRSATSLNSARPLQKSRSSQSLKSSLRHGNRPRISAPVLQHHVSFDVVNSTYSVYTPDSTVPQLVLKPTAGSREALSLSIFENPHTGRPESPESSMFPEVLSASENLISTENRASHVSLEPIHEPDASMTRAFDFSQQPHPRYTYYRGSSSPNFNIQRAELPAGPSQNKKSRHLSINDLSSVDDDLTALPQKDHFFKRHSQLNPRAQRISSGLRNVTNVSGL